MALLDNEKISDKKQNKSDKVLLSIIIVLIVLIIIIISAMVYFLGVAETLNPKLSISLNGQINDELLNEIVVQDDSNYIPIKEIASVVGYEAYNGDYIYVSEDSNKCHVIMNNEEVIQFTVDSNEAYKIKLNENLPYATITLNSPIISKNNDLYIDLTDITNSMYIYADINEKNEVEIYSLENMYIIYNSFTQGLGYTEIVNTFTNQKAILNDIIICKNNKNKYGVINSNGDIIIEHKYEDIQYIEQTQDFIVTYNGMKGIINNKQTKIGISYDEIQYVYYANIYAVTSNKKVGFFNTNGSQIIGFNYDEVGSTTSVKNAKGVKYIDTKGLIVVKNNGKYGLISKDGSMIVDFYLNDVYSIISNGKLEYYVVTDTNTLNINAIV